MDERIKKALMSFGLRAAVAALLFLALCVIKWVSPEIFSKCSAVWTKNTDLKKAGGLFIKLLREVVPF